MLFRSAAFVVTGLLIGVEYLSTPLMLQTIPTGPPPTYAEIARDRGDAPTPVLFEFPMSPFDDPIYMYFSTFHWQRLTNGYSGFFPPSQTWLAERVATFGDDGSLAALRASGVNYIVLHGERLRGDRYDTLIERFDRRTDLTLV